MKNDFFWSRERLGATKTFLLSKAPVSAAVLCVLNGIPCAATAQAQSPENQVQTKVGNQIPELEEIMVTATRREQALESVPYSLTVVGGDKIASTGVTGLVSLAAQVPGLAMYDFGAKATNTIFPIIRGLNASDASMGGFRSFEQSPVGVYLGNSPIDGFFQLEDIKQVEVLRGPQGTLYGAGALAGALRVIPNAPELNKYAGKIEIGGGVVAHASSASYTTNAMLNVPLGETMAFRVSGKYAYSPGFIDAYGIMKRTNSGLTGTPVLSNPNDPDSTAIYSGKKNWNDDKSFTGRASMLWKPTDAFSAEFAYTYAHVTGNANPGVNNRFPGGAYPLDPRVSFPRTGGDYQTYTEVEQPFENSTKLTSLDLSYDSGFATLSSTTSYFETQGSNQDDLTYFYLAQPFLLPYYAGTPVNPRFVATEAFTSSARTFSQELRLVSATDPDKRFDYVVGLFYQKQTRNGTWQIAVPGAPSDVVTDPNGRTFAQSDVQKYTDKSEFAELTWHVLSHAQITFGGRHFQQSFTDIQTYNSYTFGLTVAEEPKSSPASKSIWKINPSYEYAKDQFVYALWSQGFRRGGSNALPTSGPIGESNPVLQSYKPDSSDNYEIGVKGRLENGLSYTLAVFKILWDNPQVSGLTPALNLAVWNAKKAESKGVEFDLNTPLFLRGLSLSVGGSYQEATYTEDYRIDTDATRSISGKAGGRLPGSPKTSAAATLNYKYGFTSGYDMGIALNFTHRGPEALVTSTDPIQSTGVVNIVNLSASIGREPWRLGASITNLMDNRALQSAVNGTTTAGGLGGNASINKPREISLRLGYSF